MAGTLGLLGHATALSGGLQEREGRTSEGGSLFCQCTQPRHSPQPDPPARSLAAQGRGKAGWGSGPLVSNPFFSPSNLPFSIHNGVIAVFQRKGLPDQELFSLNEGVR